MSMEGQKSGAGCLAWAAADEIGGVLVLYDPQRRELYFGHWTDHSATWVVERRPLGIFLRELQITLADCEAALGKED